MFPLLKFSSSKPTDTWELDDCVCVSSFKLDMASAECHYNFPHSFFFVRNVFFFQWSNWNLVF